MTGNGLYQLSMVMTGGWFIIVTPTFITQLMQFAKIWCIQVVANQAVPAWLAKLGYPITRLHGR